MWMSACKSLNETQWRTKFLNVGEKIYRLEMLCNISRILFITELVFPGYFLVIWEVFLRPVFLQGELPVFM